MDQVQQRLDQYEWAYPDDPNARRELSERIVATGRRRGLISYSDVVRGITFNLPNVNGGRPFQIDASDWSDLRRAIVGELLGRMSAESYAMAGVFLSAIVVTKESGTPGSGFMDFMRHLGLLAGTDEKAELRCWTQEVQRVHDWCAKHKP